MRSATKLVLLSATWLAFPLALQAAPRHINVQQLPANTRELYETSMKLSAESFDSEKHLILRPSQSHPTPRSYAGGVLGICISRHAAPTHQPQPRMACVAHRITP